MLGAALAAGATLTISTPSSGGAETAPALADRAAALGRSESAALLELYAAESALGRARADAARLAEQSARLERNERSIQARTAIVRRSLKASQDRVAALLRELYIQGEPDPLAVILGATSLEEAVAGIDGLMRATAQNRRLSVEARLRARSLNRLRARLVEERARLARAENAARAGLARLEEAVAGRSATVASVRRARSLTAQRLAALEEQARVAKRRSDEITSTTAAAADDRPLPRERETDAASGSSRDGTCRLTQPPARARSSPTWSRITSRGRRRAVSRSASA